MSTLTGSDVELFLDLELELHGADKCEHSTHPWKQERHSDDSGAWLVLLFCICHEPEQVIFCGKYKEWCDNRADAIIACNDCKRSTSPGHAYRWVKQL